ncbi:MAG: alpha/beta hydrolase [Candidatus Dormibacteraeota bacterium]|nr:alpha/beta hydrolase [Candidatus Dormibacteraeota bacterium]
MKHGFGASVVVASLVGWALPATATPAQAATAVSPIAVRQLKGDVYELDYLLRTGSGVHDLVGVHRVVREEDHHPVSSRKAVVLVHGDAWNFNGAFLGGTHSAYSLPVYLASRGIDVWGIDLGWTLVPADTTDFSFLKGWGLQRDINDVEKAIGFARSIRRATGSPGNNRVTLLDWSRGGWTGYALLNEESQMPRGKRQVGAYIPVDTFFKVNDSSIQANMCSFEAGTNTDVANGIYAYSNDFYVQVGRLAESDPNGPSPDTLFGPPYTNLQASLTLGAATFQFGSSYAQYYHYVAGTFPGGDTTQIPDRLTYTDTSRWNDFLASASPFESSQLIADTLGISCGDTHTNFDNHLADIRVPVFYIGAGGGFGRGGLYTLSLLGSENVTSKIVSFVPANQAAVDFAHVDLWNARRADSLVWKPIYHWVTELGPQGDLSD